VVRISEVIPSKGGVIVSLGSVGAELDSVEHGALFDGPDYSVHSLAKWYGHLIHSYCSLVVAVCFTPRDSR
jgi:hypothetical protein